jgi:glycosyltransferase involved in cell wall biosynthesis
MAAAGERPRKDYVELARLLDADVVDYSYMTERAAPAARAVAASAGLPAGQVIEAILRGGRYERVCAWSERIGLPLAMLYKLADADRDLVLISSWLSGSSKALLVRRLGVHTHCRAIVSYSSSQIEIAVNRLGVPRDKLFLALQPVDERFWRPRPSLPTNLICAVGSSGRDYPTLFAAIRGMDLRLEIAVGAGDLPARALERRLDDAGRPPQATMRHLRPSELRNLYGSARFVVLPLEDVEYDAGVTALTEAMAMGKAVILTRTRGQLDVLRDGEQGLYVPPADPRALRAAIEYLVAHPDEAERMGRAGRALIEERHRLTAYVSRLASIIRGEASPWSEDVAGEGTRARAVS